MRCKVCNSNAQPNSAYCIKCGCIRCFTARRDDDNYNAHLCASCKCRKCNTIPRMNDYYFCHRCTCQTIGCPNSRCDGDKCITCNNSDDIHKSSYWLHYSANVGETYVEQNCERGVMFFVASLLWNNALSDVDDLLFDLFSYCPE